MSGESGEEAGQLARPAEAVDASPPSDPTQVDHVAEYYANHRAEPSLESVAQLAQCILCWEVPEGELFTRSQLIVLSCFFQHLNFFGYDQSPSEVLLPLLKAVFSKFTDPHATNSCLAVGKTTSGPCTVGATKYNGYCGHHQDQSIARVFPVHSLPRFNSCSLSGIALSSASATLKCFTCPRQVESQRAVVEFQCSSEEQEVLLASSAKASIFSGTGQYPI